MLCTWQLIPMASKYNQRLEIPAMWHWGNIWVDNLADKRQRSPHRSWVTCSSSPHFRNYGIKFHRQEPWVWLVCKYIVCMIHNWCMCLLSVDMDSYSFAIISHIGMLNYWPTVYILSSCNVLFPLAKHWLVSFDRLVLFKQQMFVLTMHIFISPTLQGFRSPPLPVQRPPLPSPPRPFVFLIAPLRYVLSKSNL